MQKRNSNIPTVYIVILNYKNWHEVIECLGSVYRSTYKHFKVFVIDNDSKNNSLRHIMDWAIRTSVISSIPNSFVQVQDLDKIKDFSSLPSLTLVQNEENAGFASGNNIILHLLASLDDFVWMLNPDMIITDNALFELVQFAQTQGPRTIIGSVIKFYDRPEKVHMYGGGRVRLSSGTSSLITKLKDIPELDYISGGALFTHAHSFNDIGLLPEDYFLYWEETDWCYRAKSEGYSMEVCLSSVCFDKVGTTIGRGFLAEYYYTRNGLIFLSKYRKRNLRFAILLSIVRVMKKVASGQWLRAKGVFRGVLSFMKMRAHENE